MRICMSPSLDPFINIALEELLLSNYDEEIIFLWRGTKSVVVGKNQNTLEETNPDFLADHGIDLVRRISGGGTVYHDEGNINYTFIVNNLKENFNNFRKFMEPTKEYLEHLGLSISYTDRNDLRLDGKKISGTAQFSRKDRVIHHGTLLFDADPGLISASLKPKPFLYESKSVKSVRSPVTNIKDHLEQEMSTEDFIEGLYVFLREKFEASPLIVGKDLLALAKLLKEEKYTTWGWTFGYSPAFSVAGKGQSPLGPFEFAFQIKSGKIKEASLIVEGSKVDASFLQNQPYDRSTLMEVFPAGLKLLVDHIV